jgi:hypothetical protein
VKMPRLGGKIALRDNVGNEAAEGPLTSVIGTEYRGK